MDYEKAYYDALRYFSEAVDVLTKMRDKAMKPYLKSFEIRSVNEPYEATPYDEQGKGKDKDK